MCTRKCLILRICVSSGSMLQMSDQGSKKTVHHPIIPRLVHKSEHALELYLKFFLFSCRLFVLLFKSYFALDDIHA